MLNPLPADQVLKAVSLDSDKKDLLEKIVKLLFSAQNELKNLFNDLPDAIKSNFARYPHPTLATGAIDLWVCTDGVIAFVRNGFEWEQLISVKILQQRQIRDVFENEGSKISVFINPITKMTMQGHSISLGDQSVPSNGMIEMVMQSSFSDIMIPVYSKIYIIGWDYIKCSKETAKDLALKNVQTSYAEMNIRTKKRGEDLLNEFCMLLDSECNEEEIQKFLTKNPELILPEYETFQSKPTLGGEREPDFAISIRMHGGVKWFFVEIEKPSKKIFTSKDEFQFTAQFTQAKGQLLQWESLITKYLSFFEKRFKGLYKPDFLLVYGRNKELDEARRDMIMAEFENSANRSFCTYDDLANTFLARLDRLSVFGEKEYNDGEYKLSLPNNPYIVSRYMLPQPQAE